MTHRMEYPRPQFVRDAWLNLNGSWQFEFDDRNVGAAQRWFDPGENFSQTIQVPFAFQTLPAEYTIPRFMTMSGISAISHSIRTGIKAGDITFWSGRL